jgi:outer membrane protein OmpA-like peptidoglycan-associated protein
MDARLYFQLQQQNTITSHAVKVNTLLIPIFTIILSHSYYAQKTAMYALPFNHGQNIYGISLYEQGLLVTTTRETTHLIEHKDLHGNNSVGVFSCKDTSSKELAILENIPQTKLNESCAQYVPSQDKYFVTKSILSTNHNRKETALGIFIYTKHNGSYVSQAFDFNSETFEFNNGQAFFDTTYNRLYYVSNSSDGHGGTDIYYSNLIDNQWQTPIHLGPEINTSTNQLFPTIALNGDLYFSSQKDTLSDYDLYLARWNGRTFDTPEKLGQPFNSDSDDIQIIAVRSLEQGYIVSNRNSGIDQVYAYYQERPIFQNCEPSEKPIFCYLFEETTIVPNDSLPMLYEWAFSDGNKREGLRVKHCFDQLGEYTAVLNVYDSTTKVLYANLSELQLSIQRSGLPFIESIDVSKVDSLIHFQASSSEMEDMTIDEVHWHFGDNNYEHGMQVHHQFKEAGTYNCELLFIGRNSLGDTIRKCATKPIEIVQIEATEFAHNSSEPQIAISPNEVVKSTAKDSTLYFVEFKQSVTQIPPTDPYFSNIHYEITERQSNQDSLYHYTVGSESNFNNTFNILQDLRQNGYDNSVIKDQSPTQFKISKSKNWWFIPDSIESEINRQMNKFNDIKFETGSWTISKQSFDELAYIAKVLKTQSNVSLEIVAHTDSVGTSQNNLILSEKRAMSVAEKLIELGINKNKIMTKGMGESISNTRTNAKSSLSEDRRVEFKIIREN